MGFLSLIAKLGLDISGYETGLKRAQSASSKFGRDAGSAIKNQLAGAISTGALIAATKATIDYASHITDLSDRVGISTTKLQEYSYAAKQTGGSVDDFAQAARRLAQAKFEAIKDPTGEAAKGFAQLGIAVKDLESLRIDGIVDKIGVAFRNAKDPQALLNAGFTTMGRGALPVIGAMRSGLGEMGDEAQRLGLVMGSNVVKSLDDAGDAMDRFKAKQMSALGKGLAESLPFLDGIIGRIQTLGSVLGAMSVGATKVKGATTFDQALDIAANIDRDNNATFRRDKTGVPDLSGDITKAVKEKTQAKTGGGGLGQAQLNNLQQIGAYSGVDPVVKELQLSHTTQKKIEQNTKKAVTKTMAEPPSFG